MAERPPAPPSGAIPDRPGLSVVVPVHNEAATIERALADMLHAIERQGVPFEILVCENGSRDGSRAIVERVAAADGRFRVETLPIGDYGLALRYGIRMAVYDKVVIFNADYWSAEFLDTALAGLAAHDMVIGSKVMGRDRRPLVRRLITRGLNWVLRVSFGFGGTDTHGMKAFKRATGAALAAECVSQGSMFDTELVLRAERRGVRILEKPVDTEEIRQPSYAHIVKRVPEMLTNFERMRRGLRTVERRPARIPVEHL